MKKRLLSLLLLCACLLAVPALALGEDEMGFTPSGSHDMLKLSKQEIVRLLESSPLRFDGEAMERSPSLTAPYDPGEVSQKALNAGVDRLNALRWLAGLPAVRLDSDLNRRAQYGAALLAATGTLSHHPVKPADMDSFFYQSGHNATSSSNIYQGTNATLTQAVEAFFDDSDAGNLPMLGHRRWMLNPTMNKTGLGFSPSSFTYAGQHYNFATLWAFDRSGGGIDYDYISWPASGNFPYSLFRAGQAWSVTVNPDRYSVPQLTDLTIILTRTVDGKVWTLTGSESYAPSDQGAYLGVDTTNYGVANAIIFRPELDTARYSGVYTVSIQGLKTRLGRETSLSFQVDFFDPAQPGAAPSAQPSVPLTAYADVPAGAWHEQAVAYATERGLFQGVGGNLFSPDGTMTRAMVMTVLARLDGEDTSPRLPGETWDLRGSRWAVTNHITDDLPQESQAAPGEAITLEELASMLYRYAVLRYDAEPVRNYHLPGMPDGGDVSIWAQDAANWAVDKGILIGDQDRRLNPQRTATRAQVATILQRFLTL